MLHESFLRHDRWRYLKAALATCVVALALYAWHDPMDGPNGGTWLGYGLGTAGAALIVLLAWLGVRKRRYSSNLGTVKGWVSFHVYFGLALIVIATLHTGFQFGLNIHTLAYALMVLVIASGIYGVVAYLRFPREITENRGQATRETWLDEVLELNERALKLGDEINPDVHRVVLSSTERLRMGGDWRQQLLRGVARGSGDEVAKVGEVLKQKLGASVDARAAGAEAMIFLSEEAIVETERDPTIERLKQLLEVLLRRNELVDRLNRDVQTHARLQIWLYIHVPLTAALLAALTAHIVSVFLYW